MAKKKNKINASLAAIIVAPILILWLPLVNTLCFHHYGLFHPEVFFLALGLLFAGEFFGFLNLVLIRISNLLPAVVIAILLTFSITLIQNYDFVAMRYVLLSCIVVSILLREHLSKIVCVTMLVMIFNLIVFPQHESIERSIQVNKNLPLYLHIILDEQIGEQGIPRDINGGEAYSHLLRSFFKDNGFVLYGRAYSHYNRTIESVPNLLNFRQSDIVRFHPGSFAAKSFDNRNLQDLKFFTLLAERGYGIRYYQPAYMQYCKYNKQNISACYTSPNINLKIVAGSTMSLLDKMKGIVATTLYASSVFSRIYKEYLMPLGLPNLKRPRMPTTNLQLLLDAERDLKKYNRGYAYFLHLLIPHFSYYYNEHCKLDFKGDLLMRSRRTTYKNVDGKQVKRIQVNTDETRRIRYQYYFKQGTCAFNQLQILLDQIKSYKDAIIIIHGDHGSRITRYPPMVRNLDKLENSDIRDIYSTLFAIKAPGVKKQYNDQVLGIDQIFTDNINRLFSTNFKLSHEQRFIFLRKKRSNLVLTPFKGFLNLYQLRGASREVTAH